MNKLLFLSLVVLSSCASLPTVSSFAEKKTDTDIYTHYDEASKIHYQISNDTDYLHIKLNTADFVTINKILKMGLTVYFDINGKKNDDISLEYPIANKERLSNRNKSTFNSGQNRSFELDKMLSQKTKEVVFNHYENRETFLTDFNNSEIKVTISSKSNNEIVYDLRIPFTKIAAGGLAALSDLSIGIVSGKFSPPSSGGARPTGMNSGGGKRGGGGGMSGGGGKRGGGGMSGGNRSAGMGKSVMATPVKIWFKVDLF